MTDHDAGNTPLLSLEGITKAFPDVVANDGIDLHLTQGQIHALVGENGAGKSTLLSILYGLYTPDRGTLTVRGESRHFSAPRDAMRAGIGLVQQHFSMIPVLTLSENIALSMRASGRRVSRRDAAALAGELGTRLGLVVDAHTPVRDLPIATQQRAEILNTLAHDVSVLALDEPNSLLTPDEWQDLAGVLRSLASEGVAVLLVSHKLSDVLDVAEVVTVLRNGRVVVSRATAGLDEGDIGELMVGARQDVVTAKFGSGAVPRGEPRLAIRGLEVADDRGVLAVKGVDLDVRAGEIVGIAGVDGSGQIELTEATAGVRPVARGQIRLEGVDIAHTDVRRRQRDGVAYVPADRHRSGVVASLSVADNLLLPQLRRSPLSRFGVLSVRARTRRAQELIDEYDVRVSSASAPLSTLSGGNQQKVVLARELSREPSTLIACYPTRGLDFSATRFVRDRIAEQRDGGAAVLFASNDLDELIAHTDRIVVLQGGAVVGEVVSAEADTRSLGLLMGGTQVPA